MYVLLIEVNVQGLISLVLEVRPINFRFYLYFRYIMNFFSSLLDL